jgi:hypothetical protein
MTLIEDKSMTGLPKFSITLAAAVLALAFVTAPFSAVRADDDKSPEIEITRSGVADDEVTLTLSEEAWVETSTATVRLAADLAVERGTFGAARTKLEADLAGFIDGAVWRIVDFRQRGEDSGFERWRVVAEARISEAQMADLPEKAKAASGPGRALSVAEVDYTPTRAEREATLAVLRAGIYARIAAETVALNAAFPDRTFRVRLVHLQSMEEPEMRPQMLMRSEAMASNAAAPKSVGLAGAEKAVLTASVVLAASVEQGEKQE